MKKYILEIVVFLCGAVVMILELVGSRVLSPYLGTSLIVWTSLIGIVLGSLSLGYWWGGKLADKNANCKQLSGLIFGAAVAIMFIAVYQTSILSYIERIDNIYLASVVATIVLFSVPSILLGTVSPYAVRLKMHDVESSGRTAGNLYAISTLGSIVGTFAAGFVLVAFVGTTNILFLLAFILMVSSQVLYIKRDFRLPTAIVVLAFLVGGMWMYRHASFVRGKLDIDTPYSRVTVLDVHPQEGRAMRYLITNPKEAQSGFYLDNPDELAFDYSKFYRLGDHFHPNISQALMIGGAGYSYPRDFLNMHATATLDVVEIDPGMTKIAKKYFHLVEDPRLTIHHEDGRTYLNKNKKEYDVIYGDAFKSFHALPYQLTTKEAAQKIYNSLSNNGVFIVNLIGSLGGDKGKFVRAEYYTYKTVFPQVYLFPVRDSGEQGVQNIMMVAFKSERAPTFQSSNEEFNTFLQKKLTTEPVQDMPVLTDDFAPVDNYILHLAEN